MNNRPSLDQIFAAPQGRPSLDQIFSQQPDLSPVGEDRGASRAFVQGINSDLPFGNRIAAGLGAGGAYALDSDARDMGISELYKQAKADQNASAVAHPVANIAGSVAGIAPSILASMGSGGGTGALGGAANAVKSGSTAVGDYLRGASSIGGKMARGVSVAAPAGAVYGFSNSTNDLDSAEALKDAQTGAIVGGALGAAVPVAGAAINGVRKEIGSLSSASPQTAQELRNAASPLYDKFTQSGGTYSDKLTNELADLAEKSKSSGIAGKLKPSDVELNNKLDYYASLRGAKLSPADLQKLDQELAGDATAYNMAGNRAHGKIMNDLKYEMRDRAFDPAKAAGYIKGGDPSDLPAAIDEWGKLKELERHLTNTVKGTADFASQNQSGFWRTRSITSAADDARNLANVKQQIANHEQLISSLENAKAPDTDSLLQANKLWSQSYKAKDIEKILQRSQGVENPQTSIRTGIKNLLANDKKMVGYSAEDKAVLQEAMKRGYAGGLIKLLGGRLTDSVAGGVAGMAAGGPVGAIAGTIAGKALGGVAADVAGGIQANRLRGALQNIQEGAAPSATKAAITLPKGTIPAEGGLINQTTTPALPAASQPQTVTKYEPMNYTTQEVTPAPQPNLLDKIAQAESGGNPNAKAATSSASGPFQFTNGTWKSMVNKYGNELGVSMTDKNNPTAQQRMAQALLQENTAAFQNKGIQPNNTDLYMAHFLGSANAIKAKVNLGTQKLAAALFPDAAKANKSIFYNHGQPRTVEQMYQVLAKKVS